jgi:hypothetical protein
VPASTRIGFSGTGFAEHLANVIRGLWDDDEACGALGEAARAHALKHFLQRSMGDYLESVVNRYVLVNDW